MREALVSSVCERVAVVFYPVQLDGVDPLVPVLRVLSPEVPHAVVHTDVQPALVKLVRLQNTTQKKGQKVKLVTATVALLVIQIF